MAMSSFDKDMNIIQQLSDEPNDRDGLTAGELKAKFDEGGLAVKGYLNETVRPFVNTMDTNISAHAANTNNPHSVTKAQVGLGSVPNVSTNNQTPTYTEASSLAALSSGEKLSVAFGKIAKAVSSLISHIANTSNPHSVTKSQVGLGNVPNVATNDQTPTYTAASSLTALSSGEKLSVAFGKLKKAVADLISHIANTSNPHSVTYTQTGAAAASHNHSASNITSGTLDVARGGTGQTTAKNAGTAFLTALEAGTASESMTDNTIVISSDTSGETGPWYRRPATSIWQYVKGKADAVYAAISHTHAAGDIASGTLAAARLPDATSSAKGAVKLGASGGAAAYDHNHDSRYYMLTSGTRIVSSSDSQADLNDATYRVAGNYYCNSAAGAKTVKHTPGFDTTTLVNTDMTPFTLKVTYAAGTSDVISQELRIYNTGQLYYRFYYSGGWYAWTLVRGTASSLLEKMDTGTANEVQDTTLFAASALSGETGTWYKRPATALWNYIKTKAAAELYITAGKKSGTTLGEKATAEGESTTSSGRLAHAEGNYTIAKHRAQHVFGEANIADTSTAGTTARGNYVEIVGNGDVITETPSSVTVDRSNARTLAWTGNEWIAGTLTQASDARLKDVAGEIPDVSSIRAVRFRWNDQKGEHDDKDHIGYLAQDVEAVAPYLVGEDSNGYKSLDYIALLCAKVEGLERRVAELENR